MTEQQRKVNVGIIGLGAIGERLLIKFHQHPETRIAAVCDTNEARLQSIKEKVQEAEGYNDYRELLNNPAVELVHIAVPPKYHYEVLKAAAEAGKHVLCEKPLANTYDEARGMLEAVEKAGVIHGIHFPLAYSSTVNELKARAEEELGEIKRLELNLQFPDWPRAWQQNPWIAGREQGGFVREITPHFIEVIHRLFGKIKEVKSQIDYPENGIDCETSIIATAEIENGVPLLVNGISGIAAKERIELKVIGSQKTLHFLNWGKLEESDRENTSTPIETVQTDEAGVLITELVKAVKGENHFLVTFKEGLAIQEVLEKFLQRI